MHSLSAVNYLLCKYTAVPLTDLSRELDALQSIKNHFWRQCAALSTSLSPHFVAERKLPPIPIYRINKPKIVWDGCLKSVIRTQKTKGFFSPWYMKNANTL